MCNYHCEEKKPKKLKIKSNDNWTNKSRENEGVRYHYLQKGVKICRYKKFKRLSCHVIIYRPVAATKSINQTQYRFDLI